MGASVSSEGLRWALGEVKVSSDWHHIEPEVTTVNEVETYSLQTNAGHYECCVFTSTLRWVCKNRVSFKYKLCSWEEHTINLSHMGYIPAGPLLDITVTSGELEEMHLPHWIRIDHNTSQSDIFAVLHVEISGNTVEQVAEVSSSHVKIIKPVFSPKGVITRRKLGFPVKAYYDVLIYKTTKSALTLHVYVLHPDRVLQQDVEREESSYGSIRIPKPRPDMSLLMDSHVFLSADTHTANLTPEIIPEKLKLRSKRRKPNFFEVFIRNAKSGFTLKLEAEKKKSEEKDIVWTCPIRPDDYHSSGSHRGREGQHFVDRFRTDLIDRMTDIGTILDQLLDRGLISQENYDNVREKTTTQEQMRTILKYLNSERAKDDLYEIMRGMKHLRFMVTELESK